MLPLELYLVHNIYKTCYKLVLIVISVLILY